MMNPFYKLTAAITTEFKGNDKEGELIGRENSGPAWGADPDYKCLLLNVDRHR